MGNRTATAIAIDLCNACEVEDAHVGCPMGYCTDCCPAGSVAACRGHRAGKGTR